MKTCYLTFDVDQTHYVNQEGANEMAEMVPQILAILIKKEITATWFIRIDNQIAELYGCADYLFQEYAKVIQNIKDAGHEIGWHFHSYVKSGEKWIQNNNADLVAKEMWDMRTLVEKHDLKHVRMGWTYHTLETMQVLESMGIEADFSALPRPAYTWDNSLRNWEGTTQKPYYPSKKDYRLFREGPSFSFPVVPITTMPIASEQDTEKGVLRYLNPAYHQKIYQGALDQVVNDHLVLISHPYELFGDAAHGMLSFQLEAFAQNLDYTQNKGWIFSSLFQYSKTITYEQLHRKNH